MRSRKNRRRKRSRTNERFKNTHGLYTSFFFREGSSLLPWKLLPTHLKVSSTCLDGGSYLLPWKLPSTAMEESFHKRPRKEMCSQDPTYSTKKNKNTTSKGVYDT